MISDLGILVSAYVFTRMFELIIPTTSRFRPIVMVFAILTVAVAVIVGVDFIVRAAAGITLPELSR